MAQTLDRKFKLIRVIPIEDPMVDDPDYAATQVVPDDSDSFITYKIPRGCSDVKFMSLFLDGDEADANVIPGGSYAMYGFTQGNAMDNSRVGLVARTISYTKDNDVSPISPVQEADRYGIRVSSVVPPDGATYLKIWICGNTYEEDFG